MKMKISNKEIVLLAIVIVGIVFALLYNFVIMPGIGQMNECKAALQELEIQKTNMDMIIGQQAVATSNLNNSIITATSEIQSFINDLDGEYIDSWLRKLASDNSVKIESISLIEPETMTIKYDFVAPLIIEDENEKFANSLSGETSKPLENEMIESKGFKGRKVTVNLKGSESNINRFLEALCHHTKVVDIGRYSLSMDDKDDSRRAVLELNVVAAYPLKTTSSQLVLPTEEPATEVPVEPTEESIEDDEETTEEPVESNSPEDGDIETSASEN